MTDMGIGAVHVCRTLGVTLNRYLDAQMSFAELEAALAESTRELPAGHDLFKKLYHVVNHYEIDADLRIEDLQYGLAMTGKLREIAGSLASGSADKVSRSVDAFWKR
jgi:hypothetical protein